MKKFAYYFSELNALHPFREGNGRATRMFMSLLANEAGYEFPLNRFTKEDDQLFIEGIIESFHGYSKKLESFMKDKVEVLEKKSRKI